MDFKNCVIFIKHSKRTVATASIPRGPLDHEYYLILIRGTKIGIVGIVGIVGVSDNGKAQSVTTITNGDKINKIK